MAKPKRKRPSANSAQSGQPARGQSEDRTEVAVTVVWMLTILCSLAAELAMLVCLALSRWQAASEGPNLARTAAGALLLAALVTGVLCLVLTPVVWRIRRRAPGTRTGWYSRVPGRPPLAIVVAAVLVGLAPLVTLGVLSWL